MILIVHSVYSSIEKSYEPPVGGKENTLRLFKKQTTFSCRHGVRLLGKRYKLRRMWAIFYSHEL